MIHAISKYQIWNRDSYEAGYLRTRTLSSLEPAIGNKLIKIITGQRRVGKSFVFRQIINTLVEEGAPKRSILYINMEFAAFRFIKDANGLLTLVKDFRETNADTPKCYIFIDEVQEIEGWEQAVNSLAQDFTDTYEIFLSGSNASLLSGELATLLSGRYVAFSVYPFSYGEFIGIRNLPTGQESFLSYLYEGGMPESFSLPVPETRRHYTSDLRDSIVLRDIVKRYQVRDVRLLDQLIDLLIDSIGGLFSINRLVKTLKNQGITTNAVTIGNYLEYLKDVFFIHEVLRFDVSGRKIITGERKFYLNDSSFRCYRREMKDPSPGKLLENVVYLHLKRAGYKIQVGSVTGKEIDFVAQRGNDRLYVQVAYLLADEKVITREFGNLEKVKDHYRKIVVSLDPVSLGNRNGIEHMLAWEFCLRLRE